MRSIAVVNNKGGVGKTATVRNLAGLNAQRGRQTLVIDLDQQGHASSGLGAKAENGSYDVLTGKAGLIESLVPCESIGGLYILAGGPKLEELTRPWDDAYYQPMYQRLHAGIQQFEAFVASQGAELDLCILDHGPSFSGLFEVACMLATHCIVPINPLIESVQGLGNVYHRIGLVRTQRGAVLQFLGAFINEFEKKQFQKQTLEELRKLLTREVGTTDSSGMSPLRLLKTIIPNNSAIAECVKVALPVTVAYPDSDGSVAYRALLKEIDDATKGAEQ